MKKLIVTLALTTTASLLSACAVGPLVLHETARTVGRSKHELTGGYGKTGYVAKWSFGVAENLDLGLQLETLSIGGRAKYAFVNQSEGLSFAGALGLGSSIGGSHYYGDLITSYRSSAFEPYGAVRIVHVKNDPVQFRDKSTGDVKLTIDKIEYDYGQGILGTRIWMTPDAFLSLEASSLFSMTTGVTAGSDLLFGAALGVRF